MSQEAVAKGVRRIVAVTGRAASEQLAVATTALDELTSQFNCKPEELPARVDVLRTEIRECVPASPREQAAGLTTVVDKLVADAPMIHGVRLVVGQLPSVCDGSNPGAGGSHPAEREVRVHRVRVHGRRRQGTVVGGATHDLVTKGLKAGDILRPLRTARGQGRRQAGHRPGRREERRRDPGRVGPRRGVGREVLGASRDVE